MNVIHRFMKKLKVYILLALIGAWVVSCSEDDKLTVVIQDNVERGAVLRTISNDPNAFVFDDENSVWTITIEEQDVLDGGLLGSVDVFVNYVDLTGNGVSATETQITTVDASDFAGDVNGLPRATFSLTYGEVLAALGLPFDTSYASDAIAIRFVLNLTDGRTFTNSDVTGTVQGGSFFASPFAYQANIVCPPKAGTIGTWTVDMQDSFGDGWNGAQLDVTIDGTTQSFLVSEAQGFTNTETFDITADNQTLSIIYRAGDFDGENTFQVTNPNSIEIINAGPSPPVDTELLDYCSDF